MDFEFAGGVFDDTARRKQLADDIYNGIDYLEVDATPGETNQRVLRVFLISPGPAANSSKVDTLLDDLNGVRDAFTIEGGARVSNVRVRAAARVEDHMELLVDQPGDFTDYVLHVAYAGRGTADTNFPLDLFYTQVTFNFKAGCPARFDCRKPLLVPPEPESDLFVDYMAKDYESFRQAMIDLLPKLIPDWSERRVADLGMTLLELLAYTGDQLSYYQDAVANEAYLETARQRISVRRHARVIDYAMHDGLSARTVVHLNISMGELTLVAGTEEDRFIEVMTAPKGINLPEAIPSDRREEALSASDTVFETHLRIPDFTDDPEDFVHFHQLLNDITIHNWGAQSASLPPGATSADLLGNLAYSPGTPGLDQRWRLKAHDLLLFEELVDPVTGQVLLADPNRRHLVRLTAVELYTDDLFGETVTRVFWDVADALPFRLWISHVTADGDSLPQVSIARGNLVIADQGRTFTEWYPRPPQPGVDMGGVRPDVRPLRFRLQEASLAHSIPTLSLVYRPASELLATDPRRGEPAIYRLDSTTKGASGAERRRVWRVVTPTLLNSDRFAEDVVVETDNLGRAVLRFGDNQYGSVPDDNSFFEIQYRTGQGAQGNVGADKLTYFIQRRDMGIAAVRNPLPAWGGSLPESMDEVKRLAPAAFRGALKRAVTEDDYARVTERHPKVARAVARFQWTGSWHTVFIRVDPVGGVAIDETLREDLIRWVSSFAMTGYDLEIVEPNYIPLALALEICAEPDHFPSDVERVVAETLGAERLLDGRVGYFHPDNFTFGQRLYISTIYAAVEGVPGVQSVVISGLHRQYATDVQAETRANLTRGYIDAGEFAVFRLDNDPSFPEHGILHLNVQGGIA